MQRVVPDGSITGRTKMVTEANGSKGTLSRHESILAWEHRVDQLLVEEDSQREQIEESSSEAVEACLTDFDEYLHSLTVEEHEAALAGLREYERAIQQERIDRGWHRLI